jgi:hypothetical protein
VPTLQVNDAVGTKDVCLPFELLAHDGAHGGLLIDVAFVTDGVEEVKVAKHLVG